MRFYIKQKVFSFRDKFKVTDETQKELYQVQGKMISIQNKLALQNMDGSTVLHAKKKLFRVFPQYSIFTPHDEEVAVVRKKFALRPTFSVEVGHQELRVEGSFFGHSFGVFNDTGEIASIQKKVISWGDTYEIDIHDENNLELYLFIVIIIDQIIHESKSKIDNN